MNYDKIDGYLVDIFNNVVIIEEASLKNSKFNDVSLKEMHTIDVIGTHPDTTPSAVAKELMLTLGTVTTSLNKLEKKGYIVDSPFEGDFERWIGVYARPKDKPTYLDPTDGEEAGLQELYSVDGFKQDFAKWFEFEVVEGKLKEDIL